MHKPAIAVDFDDTLFPFCELFCAHMSTTLNKYFDYQKQRSPCDSEFFGINADELNARINDFIMTPEYINRAPIDGARDAIELLSKKFSLHIVTARGEQGREDIDSRLEAHFPDIFAGVHCAADIFSPQLPSKILVCKRINAIAMVEDSQFNAMDAHKHGMRSVLIDSPWNRACNQSTILRARNWNEVHAHLIA